MMNKKKNYSYLCTKNSRVQAVIAKRILALGSLNFVIKTAFHTISDKHLIGISDQLT